MALSIRIRTVRKEDITQLKTLHDECFPIVYNEAYYNALLTNKYIVLLASIASDGSTQIEEPLDCEHQNIVGFLVGKLDKQTSACNRTESLWDILKDGISSILNYFNLATVDVKPDVEPQLSNSANNRVSAIPMNVSTQHSTDISKIFTGYVGNLGVAKKYRKMGLGSQLLKIFECLLQYNEVTNMPSSSSVNYTYSQNLFSTVNNHLAYFLEHIHSNGSIVNSGDITSNFIFLHCLCSNEGVLSFYKSQGFDILSKTPDFYYFENSTHDAYLLFKPIK